MAKPRSVLPTVRCTEALGAWLLVSWLALVWASLGPGAPTALAHARPARGSAGAVTTFFVSAAGRDSNSGTSPSRSWRTVTRVNNESLRPGDTILFEGGETFSDTTLMPGQGFEDSGAPGRPIRFGSFGDGLATLTDGVWLGTDSQHPRGPSYLSFANLALGPVRGFQGTGDHISLMRLYIANLVPPTAQQETGIQTEGSHWVIADNTIDRTGDSGMLLGANADGPGDPAGGSFYSVFRNTITNTGADPSIDWPTHGIYLKVAHARVFQNRIVRFRDDGVSARYRDATLTANYISGGQIGIAWYQYDRTPGHSQFLGNEITDMSSAGIFVCGVAEECLRPIESFDISGNAISEIHGMRLNLQPTTGAYLVRRNGVAGGF